MKKSLCKTCLWNNNKDEGFFACSFQRCIIENGWLSDKKNKNTENK